MNIRILFIPIIFCLTQFSVKAQQGLELGGWVGTAFYFGDLNTNFRFNRPGLAGGLNTRYNFNERVSVKGSLNYGQISANDADSDNQFERERNLAFKSDIIETTGQLEFNFFPFVHGSKDHWFTPYIFAGTSAFYYNPKRDFEGTTYVLRDLGTEGQAVGDEYGKFNFAFTFGGGMKWAINESWNLDFEFGIRKVFTDFIDDVSETYPNSNSLRSTRDESAVLLSSGTALDPAITEQGRQRGNSRDNDTYNFVGISFMKYFGDLNCPKISDNFY